MSSESEYQIENINEWMTELGNPHLHLSMECNNIVLQNNRIDLGYQRPSIRLDFQILRTIYV